MQSYDLSDFKTINTIIERDSKDTTYKYALLRGAVEISQEYQHLKRVNGDHVEFPLGLLIEKWLLYYYPFIENNIPQKAREEEEGAKQISFRKFFRPITEYYADNGKFSGFYKDYMKGTIPLEIVPVFRSLIKDIRRTITQYPMKFLGHSATNQYYSVFNFDRGFLLSRENFPVERDYLIRNFGTYSLSREYDMIFEILGSFISGEDAVLFQWAEFIRSASNGNVSLAASLEHLRTFPVTDRDKEPADPFTVTFSGSRDSSTVSGPGKLSKTGNHRKSITSSRSQYYGTTISGTCSRQQKRSTRTNWTKFPCRNLLKSGNRPSNCTGACSVRNIRSSLIASSRSPSPVLSILPQTGRRPQSGDSKKSAAISSRSGGSMHGACEVPVLQSPG